MEENIKTPVIDETKLPEVMKIIDDADSLMTEKDCENDKTAKAELENLQKQLREITGNHQISIRDFWHYDEATDLETVAKGTLMCLPEKKDVTEEQIADKIIEDMKDPSKVDIQL